MQAALGLALLAAALICAGCLAAAMGGRADAPTRATTAAALLLLCAVTGFHLLSSVRAFAILPALVLTGAAAALAWRWARPARPWALLRADLEEFPRLPGGPWGLAAVLAAGAVLLARTLRGWWAPSLAWDDLTYHLLRAGRWVAARGATGPEMAPNSWGYYDRFPPAGDILTAWALLPAHGDALLVAGNLLLLAIVAVGVYAASRRLGATQHHGLFAAACTVLAPPVVGYLPSAHVDTTSLACFVLGFVFLHRLAGERDPWSAVLGGGIFGLAVAVKLSNLAYALPGLGLLLVLAWRRLPAGRVRRWALSGCVAAALLGAPSFVRAWVEYGSPTYPVAVEIGGHELFAGHPAYQELLARPAPGGGDSGFRLLSALFVPGPEALAAQGVFLNPGFGLLLLVVPAWRGVRRLLRDPAQRAATLYLLFAAALVTASMLGDGATGLRAYSADSLGRFLLVPLVAVVLCAAAGMERGRLRLFCAVVLIHCLLAFPRSWSPADLAALRGFLLGPLPLLIGGTGLGLWLARRWRRMAAAVGLVALCLAMGIQIAQRSGLRSDYFRDAAAGLAHMTGRDVADLVAPWRLWQQVDGDTPQTLAVSASWAGMSPSSARYPFLGTRLQNRVVYVPIRRDGTVVDHPGAYDRLEAGDFATWLTRLVEGDVDTVVGLAPPGLESIWALRHPQIFRADPVSDPEYGMLFHLDRAAATRWLAARP